MPTKLPRHTITETPDVQAALDEVRHATGEQHVALKELVILGAEEKARRLRTERNDREQELADLAKSIFEDTLMDPDAAAEVRRSGWVRKL